eukprot:5515137-Amphidinium_carterae.1
MQTAPIPRVQPYLPSGGMAPVLSLSDKKNTQRLEASVYVRPMGSALIKCSLVHTSANGMFWTARNPKVMPA